MMPEFLPPAMGDEVMAEVRRESGAHGAALDDCFRSGCGHEAGLAQEAGPGPVAVPPAERRRQPRPRPEHVIALVEDLRAARLLVEDGTELEKPAGLATIAFIEIKLTNMAAALGGPR